MSSNKPTPPFAPATSRGSRHIKFMQEAITALEFRRKPMIATLHGACIGGEIDLTTACDIRYCSSDAFFSIKEVDLAMTADLGILQRLPSIVGFGNAMELALTGQRFTGSEAKDLGLVSKVFTSKEALEEGVKVVAGGTCVVCIPFFSSNASFFLFTSSLYF